MERMRRSKPGSEGFQGAIMTDDEALTLRVTVIGGERRADDYLVVWRGLAIGRIMRATGVPSDRSGWT
jgi:hypothetical protein